MPETSDAPTAARGEDVETAARAVYFFLLDDGSALRRFVSAASDGGVFFSSGAHCQTAAAAVRFRREEVPEVAAWLEAMEARHRSEMAASSRAAARMVNKSMARAYRGAFLACTHHQGQERVDSEGGAIDEQ